MYPNFIKFLIVFYLQNVLHCFDVHKASCNNINNLTLSEERIFFIKDLDAAVRITYYVGIIKPPTIATLRGKFKVTNWNRLL